MAFKYIYKNNDEMMAVTVTTGLGCVRFPRGTIFLDAQPVVTAGKVIVKVDVPTYLITPGGAGESVLTCLDSNNVPSVEEVLLPVWFVTA